MNKITKCTAILILALVATGCKTLKQSTDKIGVQEIEIDAVVTAKGTTTIDFQKVAPVETKDRIVKVQVKRVGEATFQELNATEYVVASNGVWLKNEVAGTMYVITSISTVTEKSLY